MSSHDEEVARISAAVTAFYDAKQPFRIFHGSTNSTRPAHNSSTVDISGLSIILGIDRGRLAATVEPNVLMDKLVRATLEHGLIPPVVVEFPGITVGGGFAGSAGESSSFTHGYFDQTVRSVEMVLATGEIVMAPEKKNVELFKGAAGALKTLGIVTKLETSLIPAKCYVVLSYPPFSSVKDMIEAV